MGKKKKGKKESRTNSLVLSFPRSTIYPPWKIVGGLEEADPSSKGREK